ncbi:hypothetical protein M569_08235 [Genlisea aurea]|uniref:Uncharacterized protein n=1 Tax=Genlisea aurea TaxID=192259 RepID=S8CP00_9LAMI|nr:hypothetical protein M569_08235 [Genlisea aurea]
MYGLVYKSILFNFAYPFVQKTAAGGNSTVRKYQRLRKKSPAEAAAATEKNAHPPRIDDSKLDHLMAALHDFKAQNNCPSNCYHQTLYMDAQKKIDALIEAYHELEKELHFVKGKVDAVGNHPHSSPFALHS